MKNNDWAFQLALLAGVCVMVFSALTFDHDRADRREQLMGMLDRFEGEGQFAFSPWRSARDVILRARDVEREARWWAEQINRESGLDVPALEGITLYWCALGEIDRRQDEAVALQGAYGELLRMVVERLEQSRVPEMRDRGLRYLYGHYLGRAQARLGDRDRAIESLMIATENIDAMLGSAEPDDGYELLGALSTSYARAGDGRMMQRALESSMRVYVHGTERRFGLALFRGDVLRDYDEEHRDDVLLRALPEMEAWLAREGESYGRGRSWIHVGWLYDSLGRGADAERAWRNAERAWERRSSERPTATNLYRHARTLALIGERDLALDRLEAALGAGYDRARWIEREDDFASLRGSERFGELARRAGELFDRRYKAMDEQ